MPEKIRDGDALRVLVRVAGADFEVDAARVEQVAGGLVPEPVQEHYVVVAGRRFPPKQLLAAVTSLDRADFTTHQARSILRRLGFAAHRLTRPPERGSEPRLGPHAGAEADALAPYAGKWVAQSGLDVLFADDDPTAVVRWLRRHNLSADAVFRVPAGSHEAGSATVASG
jgi:hypothetical protein